MLRTASRATKELFVSRYFLKIIRLAYPAAKALADKFHRLQ